MVMSKKSYEDLRSKRMEENNKRLEELKLHLLALNLKNSPSSAKLAKPRRLIQKKLDLGPVRKSSRNSRNPAPVYKEIGLPMFERPSRRSCKPRDSSFPVVSEEARANATRKAQELEATLDKKRPSFVKPMRHSHVNSGFWLGLPSQFCEKNLPKQDTTITLVDEAANTCPNRYLAEKVGLSGGWRRFAIDHELVDGDALVFHLIKPTTFKVYIVKANGSE